jgi:uncharacterized membrane protein
LKIREVVRAKYVDIIFYVLAFTAIGIFISIKTAIFLLFFLVIFGLISYSSIGLYNTVRGVKDKWLLWKILSALVVGALFYFTYGSYALLRAVSLALVLTTITLLFVRYQENRRK